MTQWIWQYKEWPNFTWDNTKILTSLNQARFAQGQLLGRVFGFNKALRDQVSELVMTEELVATSAIEGEILERDSVRSSIANRLGFDSAAYVGKPDRYVEGLIDISLDATHHFTQPLTLERLCGWQAALFPTGFSGIRKIITGDIRGDGDMQIVSGRPDKPIIHYVAPPSDRLPAELSAFIEWYNQSAVEQDGIIRAGIAHLWFELLHPFDDGNGRIGRAIIEMALAQDEKSTTRCYSMSSEIMARRKQYYKALAEVNRYGLDITLWIEWFIDCFQGALTRSLRTISNIINKAQFWQTHQSTSLNDRQRKILNRMLDLGVGGFEGGITTKKYVSITKVSRATAYRELIDLVTKGCLKPMGAKGRSSAYEINWGDD